MCVPEISKEKFIGKISFISLAVNTSLKLQLFFPWTTEIKPVITIIFVALLCGLYYECVILNILEVNFRYSLVQPATMCQVSYICHCLFFHQARVPVLVRVTQFQKRCTMRQDRSCFFQYMPLESANSNITHFEFPIKHGISALHQSLPDPTGCNPSIFFVGG